MSAYDFEVTQRAVYLVSLLRAVKESMPPHIKVEVESAPVGSHQSVGAAEKMHDLIGGKLRTLISKVRRQTGTTILPQSRVFAWALRHAVHFVGQVQQEERRIDGVPSSNREGCE